MIQATTTLTRTGWSGACRCPSARSTTGAACSIWANLVDAIALCLTHPAAANRTYLVSDGEDIATPELIRRLAAQLGRPARLWPVPVRLRASDYAALGGFDEGFFLYYEDVDLCARLWRGGREVVLCPEVQVVHDARRASRRHLRHMRWHAASMARYFSPSMGGAVHSGERDRHSGALVAR